LIWRAGLLAASALLLPTPDVRMHDAAQSRQRPKLMDGNLNTEAVPPLLRFLVRERVRDFEFGRSAEI
jgi:hypothetical protein